MASMPQTAEERRQNRLRKEKEELEKKIEEEAKAMGLPPVKRYDTPRAAAVAAMQAREREEREEEARKKREKAQETRSNIPNTAPREGEPGSASNPKYVPTLKVTPLKEEGTRVDQSSFDSEPDPREDPSAWRKWNFKRVKAAEKAGVKPESIAKSSMDKEISERNMYDVSDKKGGRIKTSPKVKRAAGGMVKPKKKTSSPRGAGCAQRGYGKAMMGGGKVKAYKAGGKVGGNRLY
jgi:hypothetical protein